MPERNLGSKTVHIVREPSFSPRARLGANYATSNATHMRRPKVIEGAAGLTIRLEPVHILSLAGKTEIINLTSPIEVDRISLSNADALQRSSRLRDPSDYQMWEQFTLPANVNRKLFSPSSIDRLKNVSREVASEGIEDLGLIVVTHNFTKTTFSNFYEGVSHSLPVETGVSYTYTALDGEQTRIAGSPIISTLHSLSKSGITMTEEQQQAIIEEHFGSYLQFLPDHDVTVLAIPPRREGSPTHNAFATYAVASPTTGNIVERIKFGERLVDLYFFAHGKGEALERNKKKAERLMLDQRYRGALQMIDEAWNMNLRALSGQNSGNEYTEMDRTIAARQEQKVSRALVYQSSTI